MRHHKKPISCYSEGMHVGLGSDLNLDSPVQSAAYETVNSSTEENVNYKKKKKSIFHLKLLLLQKRKMRWRERNVLDGGFA